MRNSLHPDNLKSIQAGSFNYAWKGVPCCKNPFDFSLYWLLVWHIKPATIIEIGTHFGGSALWLADMMSCYGLNGKVVTVDITPQSNIKDERIDFLIGDVARLGDVLTKEYLSRLPRPWLVIEDSSHMYQHTLAALSFFHPNLMKGEYIVVEDGVIDDLGLTEQYQGGPNRAIAEFLQMHPQDYCLNAGLCDFWGYNVTWNTNGFLVKTR